jgi:hypothetical protein
MRSTLSFLLFLACAPAAPTHDALEKRATALPGALQSCAVLGDTDAQNHTCSLYDTKSGAFTDAPDPLLRRVLLYQRWMDKYSTVEKQLGVRVLTTPMLPGDPESRFSDESLLAGYDALGDSASYAEETGIAAAFQCAVTGSDAACARMEEYVRGSVKQFEVTGIDGYLARAAVAVVPWGTPMQNGKALLQGAGPDGVYDIPAAIPLPDYYRAPNARPAWLGHPSIDSYVGPMNSYPIAFGLIKDSDLKKQMARHYGCFLKRLKIFQIKNLSKNPQLQHDVAAYLAQGLVHLDPDDPDLTHLDEVWGFYLPQYNRASAATYPAACPEKLADAPTEIIDVARPGYDGQLFDLFSRMSGSEDDPKAIDFTYFANVRGGDAAMLDSQATAAYLMTGDMEYLDWRDWVLDGKAQARAVARTEGAFIPPKPCRTYYRVPGVYSAIFSRLLIDGQDRDYWADLWRRKLATRELKNVNDHLWESMGAAALGEKPDLAELKTFGGAAGALDGPRRNYQLPAGDGATPTADDVRICEQGFTILGVTIPGDTVDTSIQYADSPLPLMQRPPDSWMWGRDPYRATPITHAQPAGQRQYSGIDLIEPYWIARYAGVIEDPHQDLAWK